jgi:hypothetical protein
MLQLFRLFLISTIIIYPVNGMSAEISQDTARQVAENYLRHKVRVYGNWNGSAQPSITGIELIKYKDMPVAYNAKVFPHGHLLVPYYDEFSPVLLYSETSEFIPSRVERKDSVESWILSEIYDTYNTIGKKRAALNQNALPGYNVSRVARAWETFKGTKNSSGEAIKSATATNGFASVGPLLTTTWDQPDPYNQYTPGITGSCTHTLSGCVATAWAQLMKYWNWPDSGTGSHSYGWNGQTLSADFNQTYNWGGMLNNLTASDTAAHKDAVARLISDVGIAADMEYGCEDSSSNAYADDVLDVYFKYKSTMQRIDRGAYTAVEWFNLFRTEFDAQPPRPIIFSIFAGDSGHETMADGYQTGVTDMVHINLGWSGNYNGYYDVTNNFTTDTSTWDANSQVIVTHIEPDNQNVPPTVISTVPANGATGVVVTASISAEFSKSMNASTFTTSTFTLNNGVTGTVSYDSTANTATFTPTAPLAPNTTFTATITTGVQDLAGNHMSAILVWSFTTGGVSVLLNGDFESGPTAWTEMSTAGFELIYNDPSYSHSGNWYAWLGGYDGDTDTLFQNITIPADATAADARFWYRIDTLESPGSSVNDVLNVTVESPAGGAVLQTLTTLSNLDDTAGAWVQSAPFSLLSYKGQTVRLKFKAANDSSNPTDFLVDDVTVAVTTMSSASYSLAVALSGSGQGSVHSTPAGIACDSGACTARFTANATVGLKATSDNNSLFSLWTGACNGTNDNCSVTMDSNKAVTAIFINVAPACINGPNPRYFNRLQTAFNEATNNSIVLARIYDFNEDLALNKGIGITLKGGYDTNYAVTSEFSSLTGTLTIVSGAMTVDRLLIK